MSEPVVVVGASLAGVSAVDAIREYGFDGEVVLIGDEPHRPYDRPPLSKDVLQGDRSVDDLDLRPVDWERDQGVRLELGVRASRLDVEARRLTLDDGRTCPYRSLVIATGAAPRRLPSFDGVDGAHVLRDRDDSAGLAQALRPGAQVVVIGGGFIGLEVTASARRRGCDVTVLETLPVVLSRAVGPALGEIVADLHRAEGVTIRTGVSVDGPIIGTSGALEGVRLADGEVVPSDVAVIGIGVRPATDWLVDAGLHLDDGVVVDDRLQAADSVFAAGDVARVLGETGSQRVEHWTNAVEQGRVAGRNAVATVEEREPFDSVATFWSDQYDAKIRSMGHVVDPDRVEVVRDERDPRKVVALASDEAGRLTGLITVGAASAIARCRPLLERPDSLAAAKELVA